MASEIGHSEPIERWWITTSSWGPGMRKLLGPFESRDLALDVRTYVEQVNHPVTYFVAKEPT